MSHDASAFPPELQSQGGLCLMTSFGEAHGLSCRMLAVGPYDGIESVRRNKAKIISVIHAMTIESGTLPTRQFGPLALWLYARGCRVGDSTITIENLST